MSFVIVVDTTCDLSIEEAKLLDVEMLPLMVNFKDESFKDKYEITNEQFFKKLAESDQLPTTSLISPTTFEETFHKYHDKDILVLTIASKLSGTYQSAVIAKDLCERDNIHIVDSTNTTLGLANLLRVAVELRDSNTDVKLAAAKLIDFASRLKLIAVIDVLDYLIKGGRLSKTSGMVGSVLGVKPLIKVEDGVIASIGKARGMSKAYDLARKIFQEEYDSELPITFGHSVAYDEGKTLQRCCGIETAFFGEVGSVVGTHAGPGACGVAYFVKKKC